MADGFQHAHDHERHARYFERFAQAFHRPEQVVGRGGSYYAHIGAVLAVHGRQVASGCEPQVACGEVVLVRGLCHAALRGAPLGCQVAADPLRGGDRSQAWQTAQGDYVVVVERFLEHVGRHHVAAQRLHALLHLPVRAVADANQHDDRRDAYHQPQHGEGGAQPVAGDA